MTARKLYNIFIDGLQETMSRGEASATTSLVFESVAGINTNAPAKDPNKLIGDELSQKFLEILTRLRSHEPVQYVLGEAWFYNMKFKVSPAVLIPRPETEELAASVIRDISTMQAPKVLDIGTGSGCIAIAIKKKKPGAIVSAIDVSSGALEVAKYNATLLEAEIDFKVVDFLDEQSWNKLPGVDVIVSNPPYIPSAEQQQLEKNVTAFEPHLALFVADQNPFIFYEKIRDFARQKLAADGKIFLEIHESFGNETAALFNEYETSIVKDMQGKDRMIVATRRFR